MANGYGNRYPGSGSVNPWAPLPDADESTFRYMAGKGRRRKGAGPVPDASAVKRTKRGRKKANKPRAQWLAPAEADARTAIKRVQHGKATEILLRQMNGKPDVERAWILPDGRMAIRYKEQRK